MQKDELLKSIASFPLKMASYPNVESMFLSGKRIRPIPCELENYTHNTIRIINAFTDCFITIANPSSLKEIEDNIIRSFMYTFDKSTELLYLLENGDTSDFHVQIAFESDFYQGENLPYKMQEYLTTLAAKVIICVKSTIHNVENMDTSALTIKELINTILMGAISLAFENYLRMDINEFR